MRPKAIVDFERCYLGAFVLGLINSALAWPQMVARAAAASPPGSPTGGMAGNIIVGGLVFGAIITLLLWYFTARRGSVVAKWIVTIFFAIGALSVVWQLVNGTIPHGLPGVLSIVGVALQGVAVYLLFRPDAQPWFAGEPRVDGPAVRPIDWSEPKV